MRAWWCASRRGRQLRIVLLAMVVLQLRGAESALASKGDCGQPVSDGSTPVAADCLFQLSAAVSLAECKPACICDVDASGAVTARDALMCLRAAVETTPLDGCDCGGPTTTLPATTTTTFTTVTTTLTGVTTTTLAVGGACPDTIAITWLAQAGDFCFADQDCAVGECDSTLGRCLTATEVDWGWTGVAHDVDWNHEQKLLLAVECAAATPPCGVCEVKGVVPAQGACRCKQDNRIACDEPLSADTDDCAGMPCECYLGSPLPESVGNTPFCFVNRLAEDVNGTVDVDSGASALAFSLRALVMLGENLVQPCPYCDGDVLARDGLRDGTCMSGPNDGQPCDVDAISTTFPAPGGGGSSLDCFPEPARNSSGAGLRIHLTQTTGTASLAAAVDCTSFGIPYTCHCGVCSLDQSLSCAADADCATEAAGTCQKRFNFDPRPNGCAGAGVCSETADGEASCEEGPLDHTCDGVVRANGEGFIHCLADADCSPNTIGVDAGSCTLSKRRECFSPTIVAVGAADPYAPVSAGIACIPPLSSAGKNAVFGFPGPMRLRAQHLLRRFCGGTVGTEYVPGSGCIGVVP